MQETLDLMIINPQVDGFLKHIDWNKDEMFSYIQAVTNDYHELVYSEDQIKDAKKDRAQLNALKKDIETRRKEVKNAIMQPYTDFENELAQTTKALEETIKLIDAQVKEYETRLKTEKKKVLETFFNTNLEDLEGMVTWAQVFSEDYLAQKVSIKAAQKDIMLKLDKIRQDIMVIDSMHSNYKVAAKDIYLQSFDLSLAIASANRLEERARLEEERQNAPAENKNESSQQIVEQALVTTETPKQEDKTIRTSFTIVCKKSEIAGLKAYMDLHNISYGNKQ